MKITFENKKEKKYLEEIYDENFLLNVICILENLCEKYNVLKPIIKVVNLSYDYEVISLMIKDKSRENNIYLVNFSIPDKTIFVKYPNQRNYDYYNFLYDQIVLTKEGFRSSDKAKRVERVIEYSDNKQINNINKYIYNYYINNSKYTIRMNLPKNLIFNESFFINNLLMNQEDTNDIIDLYNIIKKFLRTNNFSINIQNQNTKELLTVRNGVILRVVKNFKEDNLDYTINYHKSENNEELEITHKVLEPENNKDMQKIKKKIR